MTDSHTHFASWRWMTATLLAAVLSIATALSLSSADAKLVPASPAAPAKAAAPEANVTPVLERMAAKDPSRRVEVVVQLQSGTGLSDGRALVASAGGQTTTELPIINAVGAELTASEATKLARDENVRAVSLNAGVESSSEVPTLDDGRYPARLLKTAFNQSIRAPKVWNNDAFTDSTGRGVGVAVVDTGIDGDLKDFQNENGESRVVASAVVNPDATNADDGFGHGTHVAGLVAGNGYHRSGDDSLRGAYAGSAPDANLISVKVSDDKGDATLIDVIHGLQFVVDHKKEFNIRVVNLSLNSTVAESYKTDPLDAAVEQAWFKGIVVVVAAGNRGTEADAVNYAPANDPYVITVGGVDDKGTKDVTDDVLADWSSRGQTQDGVRKPEVLAPGAHIVSTLARNSEFPSLCPECRVDEDYFRIGGTSMSAGITSGAAAVLLEARPGLTPDQVKGALINRMRDVPGTGGETALDKAVIAPEVRLTSNQGLTPNELINPSTGEIDFERARWSRARWSEATEALRARWSRARWSSSFMCDCWDAGTEAAPDDPTVETDRARWSRARWSRARWSRARWSMSFTK